MSNIDSINAIKVLVAGIEKHIDNMDLETSKNIYDYRLKDLLHLDTAIKCCTRCGRYFIPKFGSISIQQYCSDDCRYNSTQDTRKIIKQDKKYKQIDNLRKLIYERKYRARRDNKPLDINTLNTFEYIIAELKILSKQRLKLTTKDFDNKYNELYTMYRKYRNW